MAESSSNQERSFARYKADGAAWITLATGEYYPDILPRACELYKPVLVVFGQLLQSAHSSTDLFMAISELKQQWMRIQLSRVFRKYVSPVTPVEMLKKKSAAARICEQFGAGFRNIVEVQKNFQGRPMPDDVMCALLWEYKDRGKKGYDLTERMFSILREQLPGFTMTGPERAGKDVLLGKVFPGYPKPERPVDVVIFDGDDADPARAVAVGLARYDSDRGGAQEDDRTGQYREVAQEIIGFADQNGLPRLKVIFVNDGPGLLLGSMWDDYAYIEEHWNRRVKVVTLRMIPQRITAAWLKG
jgi:hypothetical protein